MVIGGIGDSGMNIGGSGPLAAPAIARRQDDFAAIMARASSTGAPGETPQERARAAAEEFVAVTLVQPLLGQLRQGNNAAPPFAPSRGERQFQQMLDAQIARDVVRAAHYPLVDVLARQLLKDA